MLFKYSIDFETFSSHAVVGQGDSQHRKYIPLLRPSMRDIVVLARTSMLVLCHIINHQCVLRFQMGLLTLKLLLHSSAQKCTKLGLRTVSHRKGHCERMKSLRFQKYDEAYFQFCWGFVGPVNGTRSLRATWIDRPSTVVMSLFLEDLLL